MEEFFRQTYIIENNSNDRLTYGSYNYSKGFCIFRRRNNIYTGPILWIG
jgi:hypothetical protein